MTQITKIKKEQKLAYDMYDLLQKSIREHAKLFLKIGRILKEIRDYELHKHIGDGGFDTFQDFLNNPEIAVKPSTAYLYIRIYEYYVDRLGLLEQEVIEIPVNRLMRALPALKKLDDDKAKEMITDIKYMTNQDYEIEVKEKGLDFIKPSIYKDKETGLYIIDFEEKDVLKIYNKTKREKVWEQNLDITI